MVHVRRLSRCGAKAGNLNHWLATHGHRYRYLTVLDADSVMPLATLDHLVRIAASPECARVAVFQTKIEAVTAGATLFARLQGIGARPRARVLERVHARLGCLLSFGHNQLIRIEALTAVNGFDENLTCEDTVLSLELASRGWRTELADAWSYDSDPVDVAACNRRTVRWARQTVEMFRRPWYDAPLCLKLLLCRHLLSYLLPPVAILLLGLSLWTGPASLAQAMDFLAASLRLEPGFRVYGIALLPSVALFLLLVTLRTAIALLERVPVHHLALSWVLGGGAVPAPGHSAVDRSGPIHSGKLGVFCAYQLRAGQTQGQYRHGLARPRHLGRSDSGHAGSRSAAAPGMPCDRTQRRVACLLVLRPPESAHSVAGRQDGLRPSALIATGDR